MSIKGRYILFLLLFTTLLVNGQGWNSRKYEFYYGLGLSNLMSDVGAPNPNEAPAITNLVWVKFFKTVGVVTNAGLKYRFADKQYVTTTFALGQLFAEDPAGNIKYWDRGIKASSFFTEVTARYEYQIIKEKSKNTVYRKLGESSLKNINIPTYLFIGVGGEFNVGKFSKVTADGRTVEKTNYANASPVFPFGFGFKYKISPIAYVNLEAGWRFTLSDKIDYANGKDSPGTYGKWYDQYQFVTVNLVYKLRSNKKGLPIFSFR